MSSWALLGGMMGGAQAAQTLLLDRAKQMEKDKDKADEQALWTKRQIMMESLKAPAQKVETTDDPDNPGHKISITSQWNPPAQDGQKGSYQEVARVHVPVAWKESEKYINGPDGTPMVQKGFTDPDNPTNFKPTGNPIPKFDPEGQKRTALEAGRLGMEGQRLSFDKDKFAQEQADKNDPAKRAALMPFEPVTEENAATGQKTHLRFDRRTGTMGPPAQYHAPGISDIQAGGGASPLSQLSGSGGAKGVDTGTPPQAGAHGKVVRTGTNAQGQKVAQYSDGTILPI